MRVLADRRRASSRICGARSCQHGSIAALGKHHCNDNRFSKLRWRSVARKFCSRFDGAVLSCQNSTLLQIVTK